MLRHKSPDGVYRVCTATPGNCQYGQQFSSVSEILAYEKEESGFGVEPPEVDGMNVDELEEVEREFAKHQSAQHDSINETNNSSHNLRETVTSQNESSAPKRDKPKFYCDEKAVDDIYLREPEITSILTRVVIDEQNAGRKDVRMEGLEFRLKTKDSIREKIEVRKEKRSVDEFYDIVRYTVVSNTNNYYDTQKKVLQKLIDKDVRIVNLKDTWGSPGYNGVNCKLQKGKVKFELQFHTEESLEAKEKAHKIYEKQRVLSQFDPKYIEMAREMDKIFSATPVPRRS